MVDLSVNIGSLRLKNPILVASGTFGYAREFQDFLDLNRLGGIVTKTITLEERPGNPAPRIAETPAGMLNSIGLANVGIDEFVRAKMPFLQTLDTGIIVNVAGKSAEEFPEIIQRLEDVPGIDAYELNYSCPNVKQGGLEFSSNPVVAEQVTAQIRKCTRRPIIAKLTPNVTAIAAIGKAVENAGADAVSAINTLVGMAIDIRTRRPRLATIKGGLSGPAIKPVALARVYDLYKAIHIPIIGIGGIMNVSDVIEFLLAGAVAVQLGTVNFIQPAAAEQIIAELYQYCDENRITLIQELVGALRC